MQEKAVVQRVQKQIFEGIWLLLKKLYQISGTEVNDMSIGSGSRGLIGFLKDEIPQKTVKEWIFD